jgi:hypothetical protein
VKAPAYTNDLAAATFSAHNLLQMSRSKAISVLVLVFVLSNWAYAVDRHVQQVEIKSYWGGLGTPQKTELLIRNTNRSYRLGRTRVDATLVEGLATALQQPVITAPSLQSLGLNKDWLTSAAARMTQDGCGLGTSGQKALFISSYTDPDFIAKILSRLFVCCHTDDYPSVKVTLTYDDGSVVVLTSHSQSSFMLPWKIASNGSSAETFNKNISTALFALMPKRATNRERLSGKGLDFELAEIVMSDIKNDWNLLGAEAKDADALARIRAVYKIVGADVNPYHDVAFGVDWEGNKPHEQNLHVVVTRQAFPPGFAEKAILLCRSGKVLGVDDFLRNASRYEDLVLSVPWLAQLQAKYPKWGTTLLWVHNKSMSDKAMKNFAADMHDLKKDALAEEVRRMQDDVAVVNVSYGDYWLVLPDKRMVLWRYQSVSGLLGLKQSEISSVECTDYQGATGGCVGLVVSPDGKVEATAAQR